MSPWPGVFNAPASVCAPAIRFLRRKLFEVFFFKFVFIYLPHRRFSKTVLSNIYHNAEYFRRQRASLQYIL